MMFRMLLDEMVSPSLVPTLWESGIDAVALRDRDMLSATDYQVWKYAMKDYRTVVTINAPDFLNLANQEITHPGLVIIPDGGRKAQQLEYVTSATRCAVQRCVFAPTFADCCAFVDTACQVIWHDAPAIAISSFSHASRH